MARHRRTSGTAPHATPDDSSIEWAPDYAGLAAQRQHIIRGLCSSALSVAAIAPLVFAGAVGAAPPRFSAPSSRAAVAAVTPVRSVDVGPADQPNPTVVTGTHPPARVRVAPPRAAEHPQAAPNSPEVPGIPSIALTAYRHAEQTMAVSDPRCGIGWNLLAGIGRIESMHARGGATDAHGTAAQPIYGPALDGTLAGNEVVVAGAVGERVTYARAIGPMQFLPSTWARYAADGDGDGIADPQNLYDATLAAARYLCSGGLNLKDQQQTMSALLRYNNSSSYARSVLGWADAYATGVVPVDLPKPTEPAPPLGDQHVENPKGIGPGLPLNVFGLPPTDPLARTPLIELGPH
jgi:hypothetical protein